MKKYPVTSPYVERRSRLDIGLHIPVPVPFLAHPDFQQKSGVPNLLAIMVLSEILNWYRPIWEEVEVAEGKTKPRAFQRFEGDAFVLNYAYLANRFGYSIWAVKRAVYFLRDRGLLILETRAVQDEQTGEMVGKHTVAIPNFDRLAEILSPANYGGGEPEEITDAHSGPRRADAHSNARRPDKGTDAHPDAHRTDAHSDARRVTDAHTDAHPNARELQKSVKDKNQFKAAAELIKAPGDENLSRNPSADDNPETPQGTAEARDHQGSDGTLSRPDPRGEVAPEPERMLRDLGVPKKFRKRLAAAMRRGSITPEDLVAELARCYRDWERGEISRPVLAAVTSLLEDNRAPREFYDPATWDFPEDVWDILVRAGWVGDHVEADAEPEWPIVPKPASSEGGSGEPSDQLAALWRKVLNIFRREMPPTSFRRYLEPARPLAFENDVLTIATTDDEAREWLEGRITNGLKRKLVGLLGRQVDVRFVVANPAEMGGRDV